MWRLSAYERTTDENSIITEISISLQEIESNLVELVTKLTSPLFTLFDFYELPQDNYSELINNFVSGKI